MKYTFIFIAALLSSAAFSQNELVYPTLLQGEDFNLQLQLGEIEFFEGVVTNTMGANGPLLGPTLMVNQGDQVTFNVENQLDEETTIHWHGMHVAPEHDGGPHTVIFPGETWSPSFTVLDKAGLNWYHPHLHMQTDMHVSKGIAGLIIVRDEEEAALGLPMTYGVDEIPLVLQTKGFDSEGQIEIHTDMDSTVMTNGILNAYTTLPAQVVRLRVLNGSSQRIMEFGFSDDRSFSLIGTDGGLLTAPVELTRYRLSPGQRIDVLLDLTQLEDDNFQLMNFASELPNAIYGASQPGMGPGLTSTIPGYTSNPLNGNDVSFLDITVVAPTANPVTEIPTQLAEFTPLLESDADITRSLIFNMAGTTMDLQGPFSINGSMFDMETINYTIPLDNVEIWSLTNQTPIAHPFHIHDVQFFILDINGVPPPPELSGYNDIVLVPGGMGNARFIAKFEDHANDTIPYMYHCHMLSHEDMGMMGQFLVVDDHSEVSEIEKQTFNHYPNPARDILRVEFTESETLPEELLIFDAKGILVDRQPINQSVKTIGVSELAEGMYYLVAEGFMTQTFAVTR